MPALSNDRIHALLLPFLDAARLDSVLVSQLSLYLDLLLKWNARTNLTAIREPEEIVLRHFGESLFAGHILARRLKPDATLLDFGSGAGFPGLPMQLLLPELRVTLGESQGKKAAFLQEAVRTLGLRTEVWAKRVEDMPPDRRFDAVILRAVDKMEIATAAAEQRVAPGGVLAMLTSSQFASADSAENAENVPDSRERKPHSAPQNPIIVPRGTINKSCSKHLRSGIQDCSTWNNSLLGAIQTPAPCPHPTLNDAGQLIFPA